MSNPVRGYYVIRKHDEGEIHEGEMVLFEVRKSVVDDGKFPIRAFGPASLAMCQRFMAAHDSGLPDYEARKVAIAEGWRDMKANAEIARDLNARARSRRCFAISRELGLCGEYNPGDAPDLFPGWVLVDARRVDGREWTAELVAEAFVRGF